MIRAPLQRDFEGSGRTRPENLRDMIAGHETGDGACKTCIVSGRASTFSAVRRAEWYEKSHGNYKTKAKNLALGFCRFLVADLELARPTFGRWCLRAVCAHVHRCT